MTRRSGRCIPSGWHKSEVLAVSTMACSSPSSAGICRSLTGGCGRVTRRALNTLSHESEVWPPYHAHMRASISKGDKNRSYFEIATRGLPDCGEDMICSTVKVYCKVLLRRYGRSGIYSFKRSQGAFPFEKQSKSQLVGLRIEPKIPRAKSLTSLSHHRCAQGPFRVHALRSHLEYPTGCGNGMT